MRCHPPCLPGERPPEGIIPYIKLLFCQQGTACNRIPKKKEAKKKQRERRFRSDEPGCPFSWSFAPAEYITYKGGAPFLSDRHSYQHLLDAGGRRCYNLPSPLHVPLDRRRGRRRHASRHFMSRWTDDEDANRRAAAIARLRRFFPPLHVPLDRRRGRRRHNRRHCLSLCDSLAESVEIVLSASEDDSGVRA